MKEGFGGWGATWDIDIDWDDSITAANDGIGVVVVSTAVCTGAHGYYIFGVGHLVVDFS